MSFPMICCLSVLNEIFPITFTLKAKQIQINTRLKFMVTLNKNVQESTYTILGRQIYETDIT